MRRRSDAKVLILHAHPWLCMTVERCGWLDYGQMMSGFAPAETTVGPPIMVLQFAGFVAACASAGIAMAFAGVP